MTPLARAIAVARSIPKPPPRVQAPKPTVEIPAWHEPTIVPAEDIHPIRRIQIAVADAFSVTMEAMLGRRRQQKVALPRQVAMYLASELTGASLCQIGRRFDRDHTTVLSAIRKIEWMRHADLKFDFFICKLREDLRND